MTEVEFEKMDMTLSGLAKRLKTVESDLLVGVSPATLSFYKAKGADNIFDERDKLTPGTKVVDHASNQVSEETPIYAVYTPPASVAPVQAKKVQSKITF